MWATSLIEMVQSALCWNSKLHLQIIKNSQKKTPFPHTTRNQIKAALQYNTHIKSTSAVSHEHYSTIKSSFCPLFFSAQNDALTEEHVQ